MNGRTASEEPKNSSADVSKVEAVCSKQAQKQPENVRAAHGLRPGHALGCDDSLLHLERLATEQTKGTCGNKKKGGFFSLLFLFFYCLSPKPPLPCPVPLKEPFMQLFLSSKLLEAVDASAC